MTVFFIITFSGLWHCILLYVITKGVEKPDAVIIKGEDGGSPISWNIGTTFTLFSMAEIRMVKDNT